MAASTAKAAIHRRRFTVCTLPAHGGGAEVSELRQGRDNPATTSRERLPNLEVMKHTLSPAIAALAAITLLAGCSGTQEQPAASPTPAATSASPSPSPTPSATPSPSPTASASAETEAEGPAVPGFSYGEIPPVPLLVLPDLSMLDAAQAGFALEFKTLVGTFPGLTVSTATCDASGVLSAGTGSVLAYGDGSGVYTGADGSVTNYGDGSGTFTLNGIEVTNYGDGSGSYDGNGVSIFNYGDGSGQYTDTNTGVDVFIYGDGSGSEDSPRGSLFNYGDGSASYDTATTKIFNYGDGSASYDGPGLSIFNYGDGTGTVNGTAVTLDPVPPVPALGTFPPIGALAPMTSCGTKITLDSGVLFDPNSAVIRPDAAATLDSLAQALIAGGVPNAAIEGHTDSVQSEEHNQVLSEQRAAAVVEALKQRGVPTGLTSVGYGESRPVAPEQVNGVGSPAGRQANRRVEIFIPTF